MHSSPTPLGGSPDMQRIGRIAKSCALATCLTVLAACEGKDPLDANRSDPQWVAQHSPRAQVAVVFVHGIFGDTLETWTNSRKETFFDFLMKEPDVGPKVDMFAFGFRSNMFKGGSFDIQGAANRLHESLKYHKVVEYPAVVYVAHSMGGLVVIQHLLTQRALIEKTRALVFFATPQEGAQIAMIANRVANNPALNQMFPPDDGEGGHLRLLNDQWRALPARPPIVCGHEMLPTGGVMIVGWSSATRFCDGPSAGIDGSDHISIVKPDRPQHDSVVLVVNALRAHVLGEELTAKLNMPDFLEENGKLVFALTDASWRHSARLVNVGGSKLSYTVTIQPGDRLHIWPDTPSEIPARTTQNLGIALGFGPVKDTYRFYLTSDVTPKHEILVRVVDPAAVQRRQQELASAVTKELDGFLGDANTRESLGRLAVSDRTAPRELVQVAHTAIGRNGPELPEGAAWVMTAEYLSAMNWHDLAADALRAGVQSSPTTVKSASVQQLARAISVASGQKLDFASSLFGEMHALTGNVPSGTVGGTSYSAGIAIPVSLTANLQAVPSLRAYGLSLQGDLQQASGDTKAALESYRASAKIRPSPSITYRAAVLEKSSSPAPGGAQIKPGARLKLDGTVTAPDVKLKDAAR
jgi:pimeloyl-ACP methyl ester carboxylesterase